jgi:hypothetical protein
VDAWDLVKEKLSKAGDKLGTLTKDELIKKLGDTEFAATVKAGAAAWKKKPIEQVTQVDIMEYLANLPSQGVAAAAGDAVKGELTGTAMIVGAAILIGAVIISRRKK